MERAAILAGAALDTFADINGMKMCIRDSLLTDRPFGAKAVVRGPLVFSLPVEAQCRILEYTRDGVCLLYTSSYE